MLIFDWFRYFSAHDFKIKHLIFIEVLFKSAILQISKIFSAIFYVKKFTKIKWNFDEIESILFVLRFVSSVICTGGNW